MKTFSLLSAAFSLLLIGTSAMAASQSIDCRFLDPSNTDHVMVSLKSDQVGSFFYSSGDEEPGTANSDQLTLNRVKPLHSGYAAFLAQVMIPEGSGSVQFTFEYPEASVMKPGTEVKALLTTEIFGLRSDASTGADTQELVCSAQLGQ